MSSETEEWAAELYKKIHTSEANERTESFKINFTEWLNTMGKESNTLQDILKNAVFSRECTCHIYWLLS